MIPFKRNYAPGATVVELQPVPAAQSGGFILNGTDAKGNPCVTSLDFRRSLLALGAPRSGKSELLKNLLAQTISGMNSDDITIVFDTSGDYAARFYRPGKDILLGEYPDDKTQYWNMYKDMEIEPERMAPLLSKRLCAGAKNEQNRFFEVVPQRLVELALLASYQVGQRGNDRLLALFDEFSPKDAEKIGVLTNHTGELKNYFGDFKNTQALGILAQTQVVLHDLLRGCWAQHGNFGMRNFVAERGGRVLYLGYDISRGGVSDDVYGALIDLAILQALKSNRGGHVYLFLDELALLGKARPERLQNALNFGSANGLYIIAATQSITQLRALYGRDTADAALGGFASLAAFRVSLQDDIDFIQQRCGNVTAIDHYFASGQAQTQIHEVPAANTNLCLGLHPGQAIIQSQEERAFVFRPSMLSST